MNGILKRIFKVYFYLRDLDHRVQLPLFLGILAIWLGLGYLFDNGYLNFGK